MSSSSSSPSPPAAAAPPVPEITVHRQPGWLDARKSDAELRVHQLRLLRRRWLKDQELSPREPVLPPPKLGPVGRFWARFLEHDTFWRRQVFKTYNAGMTLFFTILVPTWFVHYFVKYHVLERQHGIVVTQPLVFPGDVIKETGEVLPPVEIPKSHH
ncbi:hypothetical protein JRQ81_013340 [Phrynocephalus forsythii]|uniref:NADH dehydrogenase [ubiquinone] 1 beta subcomplex subunit 6 n=1 Tax=Phrynocephalus forsythii TaxID=171643 RepID=A0A9Q1B4V3_9SAUR|nr:hypothetical protein JRQ81_013340 [Phrynocephalus forsythii]